MGTPDILNNCGNKMPKQGYSIEISNVWKIFGSQPEKALADIKAMDILPYENKGLKEVLEKVKTSNEHNRIFMVGHSNTIPSITNTLAGKDVFTKTFDESDYGNFVIVVLKKSGLSDVYTLRF